MFLLIFRMKDNLRVLSEIADIYASCVMYVIHVYRFNLLSYITNMTIYKVLMSRDNVSLDTQQVVHRIHQNSSAV